MGDGTEDDLVIKLIGAAVMAGAYSTLAKTMPEAERGLLKLAAKWSSRTAILLTEIFGDASREIAASPQPGHRQTHAGPRAR